MKITLYANGLLAATTDAIIVPGPNNACAIDSLGEEVKHWRTLQGTHDKVGRFDVKIGEAPVEGTFNDNEITGTGTGTDEYGYTTETYTFTGF